MTEPARRRPRAPLQVRDNVPSGGRVVLPPAALKSFGLLLGPAVLARLQGEKKR